MNLTSLLILLISIITKTVLKTSLLPEFSQNYEMLNERNSNPSDMKQLPQNQPDDELPNFNNSYISTQNFKNHDLNSNDFLIHINMRSLNKTLRSLRSCCRYLGNCRIL